MSDPRIDRNFRGVKCKGCGERLPFLLTDLCAYCTHERDRKEIERLRADKDHACEQLLAAIHRENDLLAEIERLTAEVSIRNRDLDILRGNAARWEKLALQYKREIERLTAEDARKDAVIEDLMESLDEAKYDEPELRSKLDKQRIKIERLTDAGYLAIRQMDGGMELDLIREELLLSLAATEQGESDE